MKKLVAVSLALLTGLSLASCGSTKESTLPDYAASEPLKGYSLLSEDEEDEVLDNLLDEAAIHEATSGKNLYASCKIFMYSSGNLESVKASMEFTGVFDTRTGNIRYTADMENFSMTATILCNGGSYQDSRAYIDYSFTDYILLQESGASLIRKSGKVCVSYCDDDEEAVDDLRDDFEFFFSPYNGDYDLTSADLYANSKGNLQFIYGTGYCVASGFTENGLMKKYGITKSDSTYYATLSRKMTVKPHYDITVKNPGAYKEITDEDYSSFDDDFRYYDIFAYGNNAFVRYLAAME